ncbi:Angiopoietin-4 [Fukomys damarensis]|uniref:Angiopoietin-4 n=1 Tax=Fukomys damarensis TaxID=885580 RepID=A0A091CQ23_FUKDA|nr:Angiopoietin-4 [Fukomys damarensis]
MLSWPATLLGSLFLLVATMTAIQGNGQQEDSPQRNQPPEEHLRFLTGNWMEELDNEVMNTTQRMLQVLNQMSYMKQKMLQTLLTANKLEDQLQAETQTLKVMKDHSSDLGPQLLMVESQQETQLHRLNKLKKQLKQMLDIQSSALTSIQSSLQAANISSSTQQKNHSQMLEIQQQLKHLVFCVMDTNGGSWAFIQCREDSTVNFEWNWEDYKQVIRLPWGRALQL